MYSWAAIVTIRFSIGGNFIGDFRGVVFGLNAVEELAHFGRRK